MSLGPSDRGGNLHNHASEGNFENCGVYRAGERAPESGIYAVTHESGHSRHRCVTLIRGERFSDCEICRRSVGYRLVRMATYLFHDDDFQAS